MTSLAFLIVECSEMFLIPATCRRVAVLMICASTVTPHVYAQSGSVADEGGLQANRNYLELLPFESIDTASGNVMLSFTDLELPGNGGRALRFERFFSNGL